MCAVNEFHRLYYASDVWRHTYWLGIRTVKCPLDLWIYQEIIHSLRPEVIVEIGTYVGGTSLFLACICDLIGNGRVVTVDVRRYPSLPRHDRIHYVTGHSLSAEVVEEVAGATQGANPVMAILDSAHDKAHVLDELRMYSRFVTPGSYIIVEDTNVNGNPVLPDFGAGPAEAVAAFLAENDRFIVDRGAERFLMTFNPSGYLKRLI